MRQYSDEELLQELKSRGFITDLILSIKDVDIAIDEFEDDFRNQIKEKITFEKKLEILKCINTDDIGDAILDNLKNTIWEEFKN